MTLSPRPEPESPHPEECTHPTPEVDHTNAQNGEVEIEAYCPDCKTNFYTSVEVSEMRRQ